MLTGTKGVKYGLTVPKRDGGKALPAKRLAAFGDDDSDDDGQKVARDIERQAARKQSDKKVAQMQAAALAEDPSIFDYDSHFDAIQATRDAPAAADRRERKSRYIEGLLDKAKERQKEQDIVYERRLLHEREAEDHLFGDKERFVTAAYKKKLEQDKKWLEEERLKEQAEAAADVRKRKHMGDFYRNLLTNNVAFGTAKARPQPAAAAPAAAAAAAGEQQGQAGSSGRGSVPDEKWEELRKAREAYEAMLARQQAGAAAEGGQAAAGAAAGSAGAAAAVPGAGERGSNGTAAPCEGSSAAAGRPQADAAQADAAAAEAAKAAEAPPPVSREDKAAAARERFLARKRKAPPG